MNSMRQLRINLFYILFFASYIGFLLFITLSPFEFGLTWQVIQKQLFYFWGTIIDFAGVIVRTRGDVLANIVVFIPFGFMLAWLNYTVDTPAYSHGLRKLLELWIWPLFFSILVETLQLFIPSRHPSIVDMVTNTMGGFGGILLFILFVRYFQNSFSEFDALIKSKWEIRLFLLLSLIILGFAWFPFTFNVSLWKAFQEFNFLRSRELGWFKIPEAVPYYILFAYWGILVVEGFRKYLNFSRQYYYYLTSAFLMVGFITFVATGSLFIPDRFMGKEDFLLSLLGAFSGFVINSILHPKKQFIISDRGPELILLLKITMAIEIVFFIFASVFPVEKSLDFSHIIQKLNWLFIPFSNYQSQEKIKMTLDFLKDIIKFIPLTFTASGIYFLQNKKWKTESYFPFFILIFILELLQVFNAKIHPDGVDLGLGILSLVLGRHVWLFLIKMLKLTDGNRTKSKVE